MPEIYARFVQQHRRSLIAVILAVLSIACVLSRGVQIDDSLGAFFGKSDPASEDYARYEAAFGSDRRVLFLISAPDVFDPEVLRTVGDYTQALKQDRQFTFAEVVSLTAVTDVLRTEDGFEFRSVVGDLPTNLAEQRLLRDRVLSGPLVEAGLVAGDGTVTAVVGRLQKTGVELGAEQERALLLEMRSILEKNRPTNPSIHVDLSGAGELEEAMRLGIQRDNQVFWSVTLVVLIALMARFVGGIRPALFAVGAVAGALLCVMACMVLARVPFDFVSAMLPVVVLTVGVADAIHIISSFRTACAHIDQDEEALVETLRRVFRPCAVSMITTVIGFASLLISSQGPVQNFGVFAAVGIASAFVLNFTLLPALLLTWPPRPRQVPHLRLQGSLDRLQQIATHSPWITVALAVALAVAGASGYARLKTGMNSRSFFRKPVPELAVLDMAEQKLGGARSVELMLQGGQGEVVDPVFLDWLGRFESRVNEDEIVTGTDSVRSLFQRVSLAMNGRAGLPHSRAIAQRWLFLYEIGGGGSDIRRWLNYDSNSQVRVSIRHAVADSGALVALVERLEEQVKSDPPPFGLKWTFTGQDVVASKISEAARKTLVESFLLASLAIFLTMIVVLGSPGLAALAMVPNIMPVAMCVGLLGWLAIPLDALTATIACVGLGIAVNDTLHCIEAFRATVGGGLAVQAALSQMAREVGVPVVHTSVVLVGGLAVLLLGDFSPTVNVGVVLCSIVSAALVYDVVLLPALLELWARRRSPQRDASAESAALALEIRR